MAGISVQGAVKFIVPTFIFLVIMGGAFALIIIGMIGLFNDRFGASLLYIGGKVHTIVYLFILNMDGSHHRVP